MLKYPCLVLDHDDTVVASEIAVNYPCFLEGLEKFRPGEYMDHPEFVHWCFHHEFADFLRIRYGFTPEECAEEYQMWKDYAKTHIPPVCEGIREIILEQKRRGGLVCVASLSGRQMIERDYDLHIGIRRHRKHKLIPTAKRPMPRPPIQKSEMHTARIDHRRLARAENQQSILHIQADSARFHIENFKIIMGVHPDALILEEIACRKAKRASVFVVKIIGGNADGVRLPGFHNLTSAPRREAS